MSIQFQRISASDLKIALPSDNSIPNLLNTYLLDYSKDSIQKLMISFLTDEYFSSLDYTGNQILEFTRKITANIIGSKTIKMNKNINEPIILTIEVARLILSYINTTNNTFGTKEIKQSDLLYLCLFLNEHNKKEEVEIQKTVIEPDRTKKIISAMLKSFGTIENTKLHLSDFSRNVKIIKDVLAKPEGIKCDILFQEKYGLKFTSYMALGYCVYAIIDNNYRKGICKFPVFDINYFFDSLHVGEQEQVIKTHFENFFKSQIKTKSLSFSNNLYDTSYLWNNNFEKIGPEKYLIKDIGFYISCFIKNIFLTFEDPYINNELLKKSNMNLSLRSEALGIVFETQIINHLRNIKEINFLNNLYNKNRNSEEISDCVFTIKNSLFLCECKAGFLSVRDTISKKSEEILEIILKKYGGEYSSNEHYESLKKEEKKGVLQIIHNYSILENESKSSFNSIDENDRTQICNASNVYGIVFVEEPMLSVIALNRLIHILNNVFVSQFNSKKFHTPIFVNISDLYKILNNCNETGKKLTFSEAISDYLTTIEEGYMDSFDSYLVTKWNYPKEVNDFEYDKIIKGLLNDLYVNAGLQAPNCI